jgi:hypothetical protein
MRVETRQKLESENTRVYVQKPRLKIPFKNFFRTLLVQKGLKWEETDDI